MMQEMSADHPNLVKPSLDKVDLPRLCSDIKKYTQGKNQNSMYTFCCNCVVIWSRILKFYNEAFAT